MGVTGNFDPLIASLSIRSGLVKKVGTVPAGINGADYIVWNPDERKYLPTQTFFNVLAYEGVDPTGVTDSTLALRAVIADAGAGAVLFFPRGTYLLSGTLTLLPGQTVQGDGAVFTRIDQISTTTATAIVSGVTTSIVVVSAAGLAVGMDIVVRNGVDYDPMPRTISSIVGTTVTVSTPFGVNLPAGGEVYTTCFLIVMTDDCRVYGIETDGNRANNPFGRWEVTGGILGSGSRLWIRDCYIHDSPGEGIQCASVEDLDIMGCVLEDLSGNGIHVGSLAPLFTGTRTAKVRGCVVKNCNLDVAVGHADGGIVLSNDVVGMVISDCQVIGTPKSGVGSIDSSDTTDIAIVGCYFKDCLLNAIDGVCPTDSGSSAIVVQGCTFDTCGVFEISSNPASTTSFVRGWKVEGCTFLNTRLLLSDAHDCVISGNTFRSTDLVTVIEQARFASCVNLMVSGNVVRDGVYGFIVSGAATKGVTLEANSFYDCRNRSFFLETAPAGDLSLIGNMFWGLNTPNGFDFISLAAVTVEQNFLIANNNIRYTGGAATIHGINASNTGNSPTIQGNVVIGTTGKGIWASGKSVVKNNYVEQTAGQCINLDGTGPVVAQGNTVRRGAGNNNSFVIQLAGSTALLINNQYTGNIQDSSGGSATLRDNDVLAS